MSKNDNVVVLESARLEKENKQITASIEKAVQSGSFFHLEQLIKKAAMAPIAVKQWRTEAGYLGLVSHNMGTHLCGYVGIEWTHPCYFQTLDKIASQIMCAHGLDWAAHLQWAKAPNICFIGFKHDLLRYMQDGGLAFVEPTQDDIDNCITECEFMAQQLKAIEIRYIV